MQSSPKRYIVETEGETEEETNKENDEMSGWRKILPDPIRRGTKRGQSPQLSLHSNYMCRQRNREKSDHALLKPYSNCFSPPPEASQCELVLLNAFWDHMQKLIPLTLLLRGGGTLCPPLRFFVLNPNRRGLGVAKILFLFLHISKEEACEIFLDQKPIQNTLELL